MGSEKSYITLVKVPFLMREAKMLQKRALRWQILSPSKLQQIGDIFANVKGVPLLGNNK